MLVISRIGHTQRVQVFMFYNTFESDVRTLCLKVEHDMWSCDNPRSWEKSELEVYTLNKNDLLYMTKSGIYVQFGSVHESTTTGDIMRNDLIMTSE